MPLFPYGESSSVLLGEVLPLPWRTARNCFQKLRTKSKFILWPWLPLILQKCDHWDICVWWSQTRYTQAEEIGSDGRKTHNLGIRVPQTPTLIPKTHHGIANKSNAWWKVSSQVGLPSLWIGIKFTDFAKSNAKVGLADYVMLTDILLLITLQSKGFEHSCFQLLWLIRLLVGWKLAGAMLEIIHVVTKLTRMITR